MDDATITMPRRGSVRVPLAVCAVCRARTKSLVSHYCLFGLFIEHCVAPVLGVSAQKIEFSGFDLMQKQMILC